MNQEALAHRKAVKEARAKFGRNEISQEELNGVVDQYIAFIKEKTGKSMSRAYIIRAL